MTCSIAQAAKPRPVEFNRDIRPLLSDNCFYCHGPDSAHRQADLRLDREKDAKADRGGAPVIVPGDVTKSELIRLITSTDPDEIMPKPESHKKLTKKQIDLFKRWIAEGAVWEEAWAYVPPKPHKTPKVKDAGWTKNWIDNFILRRLENEEIKPSPDADKVTLIRRLSIDLTGLPPTPQEVDAFVKDQSPDAYEKLVDRLLASPHYGERMAIYWLDLVRYADTVGYHGDQDHAISPYRDYVINAFNKNMRFDQFTREQLAGDLLKNPTQDQRVATGYNRMLQTSHEGGVQPKEYLAIYAADRVRNLSAVWMGGTMGCATCHDHKFDPYTSKDFYSMQAFFADVDETWQTERFGTDTVPTRRPPEILVYSDADQIELAKLTAAFDAAQSKLAAAAPELKKKMDAERLAARSPRPKAKKKPAATPDKNVPKKVAATTASVKVPEAVVQVKVEADEDNADLNVQNAKVDKAEAVPMKSYAVENNSTSEKQPKDKASDKPAIVKGSKYSPEVLALKKNVEDADKALVTFSSRGVRCMVTVSIKPRTIRLLPRGNWMDDSGPEMKPEIPEFLGKLDTGNRRATRMDLANWLTDSKNGVGGLTARVMVNRYWYLLFGRGISNVLDDFGGQGEAPTHPELLDRLALEFVESGWDVKHMMKFIVMSRTYQLSSVGRTDLAESDPLNTLYSHQSQFRFPAEVIRDSALLVSGLLVDKHGGPSAKPYQPAGYYKNLNFPIREYKEDRNENQWRRGVYTHWQRQFLHPMLKAFDAPSREECTSQRPRSNTPLAALVFLNDPSFIEASRMFATRALTEGGATTKDRLNFIFKNAVSHSGTDEQIKDMTALLGESKKYYAENPEDAKKLVKVGLKPVNSNLDKSELAAWTIVTRAVLSTNEATTRN